MISAFTPPGTAVVCIDANGLEGILHEGTGYTVLRMINGVDSRTLTKEIGVLLVEVEPPHDELGPYVGFGRARFRRAVLPRCLTDLLVSEKV